MMVIADYLTDMQTKTFFWGGIIMAVAVVGFVGIMIFKRIWKRREAESQEAGFSLADLRAMRDRGEITPQEYEQTRANVIAKVKKKAQEPPRREVKPGEQGPPDLAK